MNLTQRRALENLLARLKEPNLGGSAPHPSMDGPSHLPNGYEAVSRIYVDTWLIGGLESLLDGDAKLAEKMLSR